MGNINGKKVLQVVRTVEAGGVVIDDTTTSTTKVWSSEKTSTEITNATKNKVVYITTDTPTTSGSTYIFDKNNVTPTINDASIIGKELYQIVDGKIKYAYRVNMILNDDVYTSLVGEFGGGSQLYQHNIHLEKTSRYWLDIQILHSKSTALTRDEILDYLSTNFSAINTQYGYLKANGRWKSSDGTTYYDLIGIYYNTIREKYALITCPQTNSIIPNEQDLDDSNTLVIDIVV